MDSLASEASRVRWWLAIVLTVLLGLPPAITAQEPTATVQNLKIIALAGNGEVNDLERKVMAPLVVQVLDQNARPVDGAEVIFRFPVKGPSATFANQKSSQTFRTDADGQASANGWMANNEVGNFTIQVTATRGNEMGTISVAMSNATRVSSDVKTKHKSWWSSRTGKIVLISAAAVAVTVTVVLLTRGSSKSTTTVTAAPGSPTIGGPQ